MLPMGRPSEFDPDKQKNSRPLAPRLCSRGSVAPGATRAVRSRVHHGRQPVEGCSTASSAANQRCFARHLCGAVRSSAPCGAHALGRRSRSSSQLLVEIGLANISPISRAAYR